MDKLVVLVKGPRLTMRGAHDDQFIHAIGAAKIACRTNREPVKVPRIIIYQPRPYRTPARVILVVVSCGG